MVSRVESRFIISSINSKLHIVGCSLLLDVLKACYKSSIEASIQKAKQVNSRINFTKKGKQPSSIPTYNPGQNIWHKIEKSSKTGQEKKSLTSNFACFLTAIAKV